MTRSTKFWISRLAALVAASCGSDPDDRPCNLADPVGSCRNGLVCEEAGGQPTCVAPVLLRGRVLDPAGASVAGARVTALDANDAPATATGLSGVDGSYELRLPSPRDAKGAPLARSIKLRASAAYHETFPGGLRRSLPMRSPPPRWSRASWSCATAPPSCCSTRWPAGRAWPPSPVGWKAPPLAAACWWWPRGPAP